ncbi:FKBP-type peptidyl-prolyl cis-trans isomerase [Anaerobutyricum hallii]|jgi:trigger factor|uniref:FKBP-type peptidyl-prolyl cis-trans isomerase n=1 Tax=Anaerobutyricum hallii TaxID=39488 RepID=UPI00249257A6|nr:FKBP-type peptidyl-prolyl cis-trans isomerase [Anaerobutyricum hallii]
MIKKKIFIATAVFASICMLGGCATSKSSKKAAEATTEAAQQAKATPVKLNASEYVKLGQYKGLTIKGASTKVTDQDVEDQVNELAQDNASYEEIKDRKTVQKDDYLNVDYTTTINGKENSDYSDSNLDMHLGDGSLNVDENVDVDEKLIGAKVGDTVTIEFTFPEDYDDSSIAGKKCELAVSINMIEKEVIPEVNDALVKENTDCKTVKEYKKQVRDSLVSDKKSEAEQTNQETLWNKIMDNATQLKDFSEADIKKEVSNIKIENKEMAGYFGMSVSDFIEQYYEMSLEDYAKENLKKQCVQDLLLKENNIEITDADVDEEIQYYIDELGYKDKKEVLSAISEEEIHSELQYTKLMDALMKETTIK